MVILFNTEGRFGHQLSQFVTLIAYSEEYNRTFHHWKFQSRFAGFFNKTNTLLFTKASFKIFFFFLLYKVLKIFSVKHLILFDVEFHITNKKRNELVFDDIIEQLFLSNAKYVVTDYVFNDVPKLIKYKDFITSQLIPSTTLQIQTDDLISLLRSKHSKIIGVHIRRGDFKKFENGIFYFNDAAYCFVLDQFVKIINTSQSNIAFVICSDEKIDVNKYKAFNIYAEQRTVAEDFFILAKCDYIIAPRSIFSTMANYFSNNKIYQIIDADKQFLMKDFLESKELLASKYNLKEIKDFI